MHAKCVKYYNTLDTNLISCLLISVPLHPLPLLCGLHATVSLNQQQQSHHCQAPFTFLLSGTCLYGKVEGPPTMLERENVRGGRGHCEANCGPTVSACIHSYL